ncbi:MAG TPA: bifunctional diaminohydroxyphosphoribosylaminopyrimidine deaminase/5-amino-6-(5-phosphoribosylamino)uracil reductase RibD [Gemmatimonadaceae bacterium]|jgi:diaminohydroxyphosphoribosylaminopyrimidine deaminase/5-amino-6-(5-phosphoribosylamino)uracil reductase|nr:bifunctional diaminohydroxyphosphoribosylaminopyrimidine deaminase/5-amino-6-(5-phosphoribosylamino)uracil reductase RibD [Gemmatimonadaceae bacterium]
MSIERATQPDDGVWMRRALELAARGWGQTAPNPMVGAVVVREGVNVGEGWHTAYGAPHAEVEALRAAGDAARGATVYVTLEPCDHHGKTPPCTEALIAAGVARVVAACADPSPVARGGAEHLRAAGIDVTVGGVEEADARELNAAFFHALTSARPFVRLKLAMSIDGAIADHTRRPGWLTGEESRRRVHHLRAGSDAVAVGIGTVLADDPQLTVREVPPPRVPPTRVVFDTSARLPRTSHLARSAHDAPVVDVCWAPEPAHAAALEHLGIDLVHAATVGAALEALRERGIRSLLVEGGATLAGAFLQEALVDRLVIFRAPMVLGGGSLNAFGSLPGVRVADAIRWRVVHAERLGDDELSIYAPPA